MTVTLGFWALLLAAIPTPSDALSDHTGIYALIEKAEILPADGKPKTFRIDGAFALSDPDDRRGYLDPRWGSLYFTLSGDERDPQRLVEWRDLAKCAGTGDLVGFGARFGTHRPTLRAPGVKLEKPDHYELNWGVHKMPPRRTWHPATRLLLLPKVFAPSAGAEIAAPVVTLVVTNPRHAGDTLRLRFELTGPDGAEESSDPLVYATGGTTRWTPKTALKPGTAWSWRAWVVEDGGKDGPSVASAFRVAKGS